MRASARVARPILPTACCRRCAMSSAAMSKSRPQARPRRLDMHRDPSHIPSRPAQPSDALVVFGATGDLAHKKIFPSLYAMCECGDLKVPVIGVASPAWSVEQLRARARDSIERGAMACDQRVLDALLSALHDVTGRQRPH